VVKKLVKSAIPRVALERIQRVRKQIRNFGNLAIDYGQWETIRDWNSVDENHNPIPWYTYPATEYLSHLDLTRMKVFEYGSGNSTLWWAARSKSVESVEDDKEWFEKINTNLGAEQVRYLLEIEKDAYISAASKDADIFIIDGKYRRECAEHVVKIGGG